MKEWGKAKTGGLVVAALGILLLGAFLFSLLSLKTGILTTSQTYETPAAVVEAIIPEEPPKLVVTHIKTPEPVKALYMTNWVGGRKDLRDKLVKIIDDTELNAVVLDVKDYTGKIGFEVEDPELAAYGSEEKRIADIKEFIDILHKKNIYVIGRISAFQDSYLVKTHPEYAVKNLAGDVWKDYKGVCWLDAGAKPVWDYLLKIGDYSYSVGFDELNFDYIRFPSDGNMKDISYPFSEGRVKSEVLKEFFAYVENHYRPKGITISADLFGMTTTNKDDLGIGQILENALAHFDYVAPMVYPSHYPPGFNGYAVPAAKPYEVIHFTMTKGIEKALAASTTAMKLRPWLQDFSIGKTDYTSEMVRAQIQATYDVGLTSWMIWNASNRYTASALLPESTAEVTTNLQN